MRRMQRLTLVLGLALVPLPADAQPVFDLTGLAGAEFHRVDDFAGGMNGASISHESVSATAYNRSEFRERQQANRFDVFEPHQLARSLPSPGPGTPGASTLVTNTST